MWTFPRLTAVCSVPDGGRMAAPPGSDGAEKSMVSGRRGGVGGFSQPWALILIRPLTLLVAAGDGPGKGEGAAARDQWHAIEVPPILGDHPLFILIKLLIYFDLVLVGVGQRQPRGLFPLRSRSEMNGEQQQPNAEPELDRSRAIHEAAISKLGSRSSNKPLSL